ncbi:PAS domain S-box protein [Geomesophilobacter sediminis]|uniref:histidine kinase n=1 Tax=Geomesophilobacter sediminis TaxID=2798584 RepID=A0A8J7J1D4_9BACT|nr:PAS domain S-box protein [Geomesophilobacter sediminis]MBJ6724498.1 PAS domain S-box protein [Geomesophilobacter sediminis]
MSFRFRHVLPRALPLFALLALLFCSVPARALEKATVQLKWLPHYQFAGYYAAQEKGFYRQAGLEVTIREGGPDVDVEKTVLSGKADFGIGTSALLLNRARGEDLVVLAQIFQHSPAVFLVPKSAGIHSIREMKGRRFMYCAQHGDMLAVLKKFGIGEKDIRMVPHRGNPDDLIAGRADVMIAYNFNEPFALEKAGEPYLTFSPMSEGIDFYGDNLFATRAFIEKNPKRVQAFREATLRGWRYAMEHKEEVADLIIARYAPAANREWLLFEAHQMEYLIQPTLVELGYQNPSRWQHIKEVFVSLGMLPHDFDPLPVMYRPQQVKDYRLLITTILVSGTIIAILAFVVGLFLRLNRRLKTANRELALNEGRMRLIFDVSLAGILMVDAKGTITVANQRMAELFGIPLDQLIGRSYASLVHPEQKVTGTQAMQDLIQGKIDRVFTERRYLRPDGSDFWGFLSGRRHEAPDGSLLALIGVITDITEVKRAEFALKESERRYRTLFDMMHEGFAINEIICDAAGRPIDYRFLDVNPAFERLTGHSRAGSVGRTAREILPGIEEQRIETYGKVALTGEPAESESYLKELDLYFRTKAYSPEPGKFVVIYEDVTAQKRALREVREREAKLRVILESSQAGIVTIDASGIITYANGRVAELLGYPSEEFVGTPYADHVCASQREEAARGLDAIFTGAKSRLSTERCYVRKDGTLLWGYLTAGRVEADSDGRVSILGVITDISDVKQVESDLKESRSFLSDLIEYSGMLIAVKDRDGRYEMVNRKWEQETGIPRERCLGKRDTELFPGSGEAFRRNDGDVFTSGRSIVREEVLDGPGGRRYFLSSKFPVKGKDDAIRAVCVMTTEITDRKRAEEERLKLEQQFLHAQKLESLGVLAGGIAHDFNNILTAILGNADLALMKVPNESPATDNLHRIERAAAQAGELAKQMLAYSGRGKFVIEPLDLNQLLEEMLHMLEVSISKKAALRLHLARPLLSVEADATQLRQVIMNLVINASEAIGDQPGVISITTGCMDCEHSYLNDVWVEGDIPAGRYVFLEVADDGCGMDRETMAKIFDPFFTTKFTGRGLGMAAVLGIIRGHKGAVKIYSEPGRGSTFKILLPALEKEAEPAAAGTAPEKWLGEGTVLLVDDEETVRAIGQEMLAALGFDVITANDGVQALEIYRSRDDIRFVILDLTMPHLDGEECFRKLRQINPDLKVIISSGYNEHEVTQKFVGKGLAGFIQKPYKLSTLREVIGKLER